MAKKLLWRKWLCHVYCWWFEPWLSNCLLLCHSLKEIQLCLVAVPLTKAMQHTGKCFSAIGQLYGDQPQCDWIPLLTGINEYKAVLSTFPTILTNQKVSITVAYIHNIFPPKSMQPQYTRFANRAWVLQNCLASIGPDAWAKSRFSMVSAIADRINIAVRNWCDSNE